MIPLFNPDVAWCAGRVCAQIRSNFIGPGKVTRDFEALLAEKTGVRHAIATTSGTTALMLSLMALELPERSTVLFPAYGMLAGANAARLLGHNVWLGDVNENGICNCYGDSCAARIYIDHNGRQIPEHIGLNMNSIEDACTALGCINGILGDIATLSFAPQKIVTSVPGDEYVVLMDPEGQIRMRQIGEFVDEGQFHGWRAACFDEHSKTVFSEIYGTVKHPSCEPLLEVILENGRRVCVTASHALFVLNVDGDIKTIATKDLRVGDVCVAPQRIPIERREYQKIDIFGYLKREMPEYSLTDSTHGSITGQGRRSLRLKDAGRENITRNSTVGWRSFQISPTVTIDEEMAYFLGWFAAEGSFGSSAALSMHRKESGTANQLLKIAKNHLGCRGKIHRHGKNGIAVRFGGRWICSILKDAIGTGSGAARKRVPDCIFNSPDSVIDSFLDGYFSGDGCERAGSRGSHDIRAKTVSIELLQGLQLLMLIRGRHFSSGREAASYRRFPGYVSPTRETYSIRVTKKNGKNVRSNVIPKNRLFDFSLHGKSGASKDHILKMSSCPGLRQLAIGDLSFLRVMSINEIPSPEFVYDLSVKGTENFYGGCGFIALHNTGQGGAVLTDDDELATRVRRLVDHGGDWRETRTFKRIGGNFRFNDIQAAMGLAQLERLDTLIYHRKDVRMWYRGWLPQISPDDGWMVMFPSRDAAGLVSHLKAHDVESSQLYPPVNWSEPYKTEERFPGAEAFHAKHVYLPSHPRVTFEDVQRICELILEFENDLPVPCGAD